MRTISLAPEIPGALFTRVAEMPRVGFLGDNGKSMMNYSEHYIDGRWQASAGSKKIDVLSASTEEVIGSIPEGTADDVNKAAAAARRAFDSWSETPREERAQWLEKLAGALKERTETIARTIAMEVGSPISIATSIQAGLPVTVTNSYANLL